MKKIIIISAVLLSLEGYAYSGEILLIDDFSSSEKSRITNTKWEGITDQVMGGKSDINIRRIPAESGTVLKMEGNVSLEKTEDLYRFASCLKTLKNILMRKNSME